MVNELAPWPTLADALLADPVIQSRRQQFAAILYGELEQRGPMPSGALDRREFEFQFHALRISSAQDLASRLVVLLEMASSGNAGSSATRRWILLLLRWAHENDEAKIVGELLSSATDRGVGPWWTYFGASEEAGAAAIDLDRASADLTYREAMDLRWALDVWRESGAHWPGDPANSPDPESAAQRSRPSTKRRRSRH